MMTKFGRKSKRFWRMEIFLIFISLAFSRFAYATGQCDEGKYGRDCILECHCNASEICDTDGTCTTCSELWGGPTCQLQLENIALNKKTSQGPKTKKDKLSNYAVDGDLKTRSWTQNGDENGTVWWSVDLGQETSIEKIIVNFYGTENIDDKAGVERRRPGWMLTLSNTTTNSSTDGWMCYEDSANEIPPITMPLTNCTSTSRYVNLFNKRMKPTTWSRLPNLELSEVMVLTDKGCSDGSYGDKCDKQCGNCGNGICNREDGKCTPCKSGYFGDTCSELCPHNCDNAGCGLTDGKCIGKCIDGFHGDTCSETCHVNCDRNACSRNGTCIACGKGFHGDKCEKTCSTNCENSECERADGKCIGKCKAGFYGDTCSDNCYGNCVGNTCLRNGTCTECKEGFHGDKCEKPCSNCMTKCYKDTGNCFEDGCKMGYYGSKCENVCNETCVKGEGCDMLSGKCGKCDDDKYGDFCEIDCNTNCIDNKCQRNGTCVQGCKNESVHGSKCDQLCSKSVTNCVLCEDKNGPLHCISCSNAMYGSNCENQCPDNCENCKSDTECTHCLEGYSGQTCMDTCSVDKCKTCNTEGKCLICEPGYFGEDCSGRCLGTCEICKTKDEDPSMSTCEICKKKYFLLKGICVNCGSDCAACSNFGNCTECPPGRFGTICGQECPKQCSECTSEDVCIKCRDGFDEPSRKCECSHNCLREGDWCGLNGTCTKRCVNGKTGRTCRNDCDNKEFCKRCQQYQGGCEECISGYYGKLSFCDQKCGNCLKEPSGEVKCDIKSGECPGACIVGYYGPHCNLTCNKNCDKSKGCNKISGKCLACESGFFGEKCMVECNDNCLSEKCDQNSGECAKCKPGFYGIDCSKQCSSNCENECDKKSGQCAECIPGFHGRYCEEECSENCDKECDQDSGICKECKAMYYGDFCKKGCGRNCDLHCDRITGSCSCRIGYYGEYCTKNCSENCGNNGGCNQQNGTCSEGCMSGWFNETCESMCNMGCRDKICHQITAECSFGCMDKYEGIYCETAKVDTAGLDLGVVIGAIFGVLVVLIIVGIIIYFIYKRKRPLKAENGKINGTKHQEIGLAANGGRRQVYHTEHELTKDQSVPLLAAKPDQSDYYNVNTDILVSTFTEYLQNKKREDSDWYKQEFMKLPKGLLKPFDDAQSFKNRGKCRYKQLYPYDETRVKLEPELEDETDFINASYVDGYKSPKAFIAAQGPVDGTVNDFWRMIFQKDCGKIVMLTNLFEECKMKCVRYWPEKDEPQKYGCYEVAMLTEDELPNYTKRHLQATNCKTKEIKDFQHLHFTAWPDRGVPDNPSVMLQFRDLVMSEHTFLDGPILVHCSAGIGRTGTFVALDYLLKQAHVEPRIDLFKTITHMRNQRTNFVQTDIQYEFVHNAIAEALNTKDSEVTEAEFSKYYSSMLEEGTDAGKTKLEEQFEIVNQMSPVLDDDCFSMGNKEENIEKNRYKDILPLDTCRAYLSTPVKGSNEYINAVFVPTCLNKTGFLITQMPLPHTVTDFWRLVYDQHVSNIVMMNNVDDDDETIAEYWPSDDSTYGPFRVKLMNCFDNEDFTVTSIELTHTSLSKLTTMTVKLFRYEGWSEDENLPETTQSLTRLISRVSMSHRDSKTEPIIVHCMDGAERSGLFCAVSCVLERLQVEKKINIPQTVIQLRARRPQLIKSYEQFHFCYQAVLEHLEANETYSNVL